ncbi:hypothetical protein SAMN05216559_0964 [Halomicrobium zhouii]|uniref:Uncharacterized protein n=1 Tax=Halomicrobium zhouii TaxID=767519 RepID=A0A1I6KKG5_9EURY|nr:hypothetical protein [Halomicrobium zhouii]SFR91753.1 hypothetical protein SAMN05216559_0964 [Halomicrobium zhouii]
MVPGLDPGEPMPDSLAQGNDGSSDGNDWFTVLFVLLAVVLLALAFGYVMYG